MTKEKNPFAYAKKELSCSNCKQPVWVVADPMCSPSAKYIWTCLNCKTDNEYIRYIDIIRPEAIDEEEAEKLFKDGAVLVRKK